MTLIDARFPPASDTIAGNRGLSLLVTMRSRPTLKSRTVPSWRFNSSQSATLELMPGIFSAPRLSANAVN